MPSMPATFPGAVVTGPGRLELCDLPALEPGPYDCVCRIEACSICAATDTHIIDGSFPAAWLPAVPFVLGHESAGRVTAVGSKVRHFREGQLVVRAMWRPDSERAGGFASAWGGFASWGLVRDIRAMVNDTGCELDHLWADCLPLPDMPPADATLFVTWRDAMACVSQMGIASGQRVAVFGSGGNGLAFTRFASLMGATVVMIGNPARETHARRVGASALIDYRGETDAVAAAVRAVFGGRGAEFVIEAAGVPAAAAQGINCLDDDGTLFLFGITADQVFGADVMAGPARYRVMKKYTPEYTAHGQVLTHYMTGRINAADFYDGTLPLDQIHEGFDCIRRREAIKIAIEMPH